MPGIRTWVRLSPQGSARGFKQWFRGGVLSALWACSVPVWAALGVSVGQAPAPAPIYPGEVTQLRITLSNSNPAAAITNVSFANDLPGVLPNGLRVAGVAVYTCTDPATGVSSPGLGVLNAPDGTQTVGLSGGVVPARANNTDGTCEITVPVTAGTNSGNAANYTYTFANSSVQGTDNNGVVTNLGSVAQNIEVRAMDRPGIAKSFNPATLVLGGASGQLTLTLTNTNPVSIPGFNVQDNLPSNVVLANPPVASAACNNGAASPVVTAVAGGSVASASGDLPARSGATNGTCSVVLNVVAANTGGSYQTTTTNTINATTDFTNTVGIPAAANATAQVTTRSPLRVVKTVNANALASGEPGSFTITLHNDSGTPLSMVGFTDDPVDGTTAGNSNPWGLKVVPASLANTCGAVVAATANNTGVQSTGGAVPANGSCTVTVPFTGTVEQTNTPRTYTNTLPQGAVDVGNAAIVSQTASASVIVYENLDIQKSLSPSNAAPGNPVRYQVTVNNWSASSISNLQITDPLTNGQTFLNGTIGGSNYTPSVSPAGCVAVGTPAVTGDTSVALTVNTVPARSGVNTPGSCTVTFWAMVPTTATANQAYANVLPANSVCHNPGAGNVCNGGASNTVGGNVNTNVLALVKSFNPGPTLPEGTVSRLTLRLDNLSAQPLVNTTLSDNLPAAVSGLGQMRVANPPNAATTCGGAPSITAQAGATSVSMNGATVPARADNGTGAAGSCVLQVDVVGGAGTYNNQATGSGTQTFANGAPPVGTSPFTSNTATLTYNSVLAATKSFVPAAVSSGGRSTVRVQLNNTSGVALASVSVTDPLPSGMVLATPTNAYTTCAGATTITGAAGASAITLAGAQLAGGGSCSLVFDVLVTGSANWVNTIPAGNITAAGGISNQTAVTATLNFNAPTNLTVSKTTNPTTLTFPGQVSRLTIAVTAGTQSVTGLSLIDHFTSDGTAGGTPNGMAIAPSPGASTTCTGGAVNAVPGATSVGLGLATLPANAACVVEVNVVSTAVGGITNRIPAGTLRTDQGLTNAFEASTSLTTQSNMGVAKQFTPRVVVPGSRSRLRITFYNPTAQPLSNLAVTDTLPAGVTVPAGPNPVSTCSGAVVASPAANQVQVSGGTMPASSGGAAASCYVEIDVQVAAQGDYTNTIPANGVTATAGGVVVTNAQPASDVLRAKLPVVLNKAIADNTLDAGNPGGFTTGTANRAPGATATLTVRLNNPNNTALTGAAFEDALPSGLTVAPTPGASTTCSGGTVLAAPAGTSVRLTGATLAANSVCTVTVNVLSNTPGTYTNTLAAGAVTTVEGVTNAEPTQAALLVSSPPAVAKQFNPPVIPPNGISTLTIWLTNSNPAPITLTQALTDNLPTAPGAVVVSATPNLSGTCSLGAVAAAAGSSSVVYASGASVPAGGCTIQVDVTAPSPGVYNNNIPAGGLQTTAGSNADAANAVLTVSTQGYVSGRVFQDNNTSPNGTFEPGVDTPLAAVFMELRSGSTCGGAVLGTTSTDVLGNYQFTGLAAGTYSVCQPVQPTGLVNGITTAGAVVSSLGSTGAAGTASNPSAATSQVVGVVLNGDGAGGAVSGSTGNNFAEVATSSIAGVVFVDDNNNGVQNGSDAPIAAVTIELLNGSNVVVATTTTDANGRYAFSGLLPGTYNLRQPTQPPSTSSGLTVPGAVPNGGTAGSATPPTTTPSRISGLVLPPNTTSTANNFAELPNGRTLSGTVYLDYDNNGSLGAAPDHGLSGQVVNLTGTDESGNPVTRSTTTGTDGRYSFTGLPPGTYTVSQATQPTGTTNGTTTAGAAGGAASNPTATTSQIAGVVLTGPVTVAPANDFAEVPQPVPDLAITKTHTPVAFAAASSTGYYTITVRNTGLAATSGVVTVVDNLPAGMTLSAAPSGAGWTCSGGVGAAVATCTRGAPIAAAGTAPVITVPVAVNHQVLKATTGSRTRPPSL